ncbi:MAG: hypothetical protein IJG32_05925, partial [Selenomonadaceae bacterium]|nr:hypothetical protein [Selenomonadaceae bacterium]
MALLDKYEAKMGKKLFERYDDYSMWNGILESSGKETPTPHGDDAIIVFGGKEFPSAYVAPLKTRQDSNIKYSIGNDAEQSFFSKTWNKFAKALHLDGDKIITEEGRRKARLQEQEKAMADYLKEPTKENKQRMKKLGVTKGQLDAYMNGEEYLTGIGLIQNYRSSPSRIADKVAVFRAFFRMGDRAQDKLVKLRDQFQNHYNKAMNFVKDEKAHAQLVDLLLDGDVTEQEFGTLTEAEVNKIKADNPQNTTQAIQRAKIEKICKEQEVSENVAKAYLELRRQLNRTHTLADDAHRRPQNKADYLSANQYEELRDNKFIKNLKIHDTQDENGRNLVTWTEYANQEREYTVDGPARGRFLMDDAIQILDERQNPDGSYTVTVREGIPELNKIRGYIPHFFHEFHVAVKDANGKQVGDIIGTGRTQREAIKIAEQWKKNHSLKDGENIHITPRTFGQTLGVSENNTPIMGDKDFEVMMSRIKKNTGTTLAEAKQIVDGAVKTKNRHRFLGQLLKRKGYKGYEQDMDWVLRHHFNTVARYVALETEFKPKAISLFERVFGDFYKDHSKNLLAKYTKDYINDVNGNPAWIDEVVNQTLKQNSTWRKWFLPNIGEQGFQRLGNSVAGRIAYLKLGMGNISSALLNFSQLTNAAGYVGWQPLMKHFGRILAHGGKLNQNELRILNGSGVIADIGLDTASGYDKNRGYGSSLPILKQLDWLGNKSMIPFQKCDTLCRMSTALAAYENAIKDGKTRTQALEYAKKINRDANFSYGVEDAPNIFRRTSTFGKVGLQFMKYPIKQLEVIADFLPQNKKTTFKQKAAFWIPYFFMSGLIGFIPFFDWGDDKLSKNFNIFPKDFMQKLVIQGTQEIFGKDSEAGRMVGKVIMYGAPAL